MPTFPFNFPAAFGSGGVSSVAIYGPDGNLQTEIAYGTAGYVSISGASGSGPGAALNLGSCHSNHAMVVTSGASVSAGAVQFQGSLDGVNWFNLGSAVTTNAASTTFAPVVITNQPVQYLRANITTPIAGGGTVSALVASA